MVGHYRKFIEKFATIADPLRKLLCKDTSFQWRQEQQRAFEELRTALLKPPVLQVPNFSRKFTLTTDASGIGISAVLSQENDEGKSMWWATTQGLSVDRRPVTVRLKESC